MAFKMKGSPMKRNFGVGAQSPIKQTENTLRGVDIDPMAHKRLDASKIPSFRDFVSADQHRDLWKNWREKRAKRKEEKELAEIEAAKQQDALAFDKEIDLQTEEPDLTSDLMESVEEKQTPSITVLEPSEADKSRAKAELEKQQQKEKQEQEQKELTIKKVVKPSSIVKKPNLKDNKYVKMQRKLDLANKLKDKYSNISLN